MIRYQKTLSTLVFLGLLFLGLAISCKNVPGKSMNSEQAMLQTYDPEWKEIDSLVQRGLLRDAMDKLEDLEKAIYPKGGDAQKIKYLVYFSGIQSQLEEDGGVKTIDRFEQGVQILSGTPKAIVHSMLGELYAGYLSQNIWQLRNRTRVEQAEGDDIRNWDIPQLIERINHHYFSSLDPVTRSVPADQYSEILTEKTWADTLRPTIYDLLAHRAIDYFMQDYGFLTEPVTAFNLNRAEFLLPYDQFVDLNIEHTDSMSRTYRAMQLFQDLLQFRIAEKDTAALLDTDLKRLQFVYDRSQHDEKDGMYLQRLGEWESLAEGTGFETTLIYLQAQYYAGKGWNYSAGNPETEKYRWDLKKAKELCDKALSMDSTSRGSKLCMSLIDNIQSTQFDVQVEEVNLPGEDILAYLKYKNLDEIQFRIIKVGDNPDALRFDRGETGREKMLEEYLKKSPERAWSLTPPDEGDFQMHAIEFGIDQLPLGHYALLANQGSEWNEEETISCLHFQVSGLAFFQSKMQDEAGSYIIADRKLGKPLPGVEVEFYLNEYNPSGRRNIWRLTGRSTTNIDGRVKAMGSGDRNNVSLRLTKGEDVLFHEDGFNQSSYQYNRRENKQTYLFLDRSIYRPGQEVFFKGYLLNFDRDRIPSIAPNQRILVYLQDANGQKKSEMELRTNAYGTFSGSFIAPETGLRGFMGIRTDVGNGNARFRVEEYKRPTFEVKMEEIEEAYVLGSEVEIRGKALSYAGSAISNARASYRVVRDVYYPYFPWWLRIWPPAGGQKEIANGTLTTADDGSFAVSFEAEPDATASSKFNPVFKFRVMIDVIDITGETQSGSKSMSLGFESFKVNVPINDKVALKDLQKVTIDMTNFNNQPVTAVANLQIARLEGPDRPLRDRYWPVPDYRFLGASAYESDFSSYASPDKQNMSDWEVQTETDNIRLSVKGGDTINLKQHIPITGSYRLSWEFVREGDTVKLVQYTNVFDQQTNVYNQSANLPNHLLYIHNLNAASYQPGEQAVIKQVANSIGLWVYNVIERTDKTEEGWFQVAGGNEATIPIYASDRGGLATHDTYIFNNRFYQEQLNIPVPWSDKDLNIEWISYREETLPGAEEEWRLKISGPKKDPVMAEFLGSMYDASLDAITGHKWHFGPYPGFWSRWSSRHTGFNQSVSNFLNYRREPVYPDRNIPPVQYRNLNWFGFHLTYGVYLLPSDQSVLYEMDAGAVTKRQQNAAPGEAMEESAVANLIRDESAPAPPPAPEGEEPETQVQIRENLDETVFFFPDIQTDKDGNITLKFKMNEALTRWKFQGFAHTKELQFALTEKTVVTKKDLMVFPNAPRFLRQGDQLDFPVKVSSLSEKELTGTLEFAILDAATGADISAKFGLEQGNLPFSVKPGLSIVRNFSINIPKNHLLPVKYRVIARAGSIGDGQEALLPVLSNRTLVTETMPLTIKAGETKTATFTELQSNTSQSLENYQYSLEFTTNPAWYVVKALPYLMEYPHPCAEQIFSRVYANMLGAHITAQIPAIQEVFEEWSTGDNQEELLSNLSRNQDLKSAMLEETPWVMEAMSEEEQQRRIALLFDLARVTRETSRELGKLSAMQLSNGGFPWFQGGRDNRYITQYILEGFGHLRKLGAIDYKEHQGLEQMIDRAVRYMDDRAAESHANLVKLAKANEIKLEDDHLSQIDIHYLYTRSFYPEVEQSEQARQAESYYAGQGDKYWTKKGLYQQAMLGLYFKRGGKNELSSDITKSIDQRSLRDEELGRYWKVETGYYWYQLPLERQALMVELYHEMQYPTATIDELRLWLLRNKQTTHWATTKSTAAAVYAFLLHGTEWLQQEAPLQVTLGGQEVSFIDRGSNAGTGYVKEVWSGEEVSNSFARIEVKNPNNHLAWGAAYWQYFEDLDKIQRSDDDAIQLRKVLSIERNSDSGPVLIPFQEGEIIRQGDKVTVRIEIEVDRPMEYVHFKDQRAAGLEPVEQLSQYVWKGGLGYYRSSGDLSTDFFIDYLPRGHYVLEYSLRAQQPGTFSSGIGTLQCMYAPEFASHTEGRTVKIKAQ